ncbi:MAG: transposase [Oscillospiraceae bacterium]|nr:transposase [Oscillospiraceae bacterium]
MELPKRKRNRLMNYDYSSNGVYFVTICTEGRQKVLCEIVGDGSPVPKEAGRIAEKMIRKIPEKYPDVSVDNYVVMPNHIHLLLAINEPDKMRNASPAMGTVVGWYKYQVTKMVNEMSGTQGTKLFQRSFRDHIIRGEKDYLKIWEYIEYNPLKWREDCFYTE